jgi:hypothetical protein
MKKALAAKVEKAKKEKAKDKDKGADPNATMTTMQVQPE